MRYLIIIDYYLYIVQKNEVLIAYHYMIKLAVISQNIVLKSTFLKFLGVIAQENKILIKLR